MRQFVTVLIISLSFLESVLGETRDRDVIKPGIQAEAKVIRDTYGVAHIQAQNEHDLFFLQGFIHAQDRLFQMDVTRRRFSGTLAELLGPNWLASDVQLRTIGLRRAAERSLGLISTRARAAFEAYAEGVNAFVKVNQLPSEYASLEIRNFEEWTPIDSLVIGKFLLFGSSFDLSDIENTIKLSSYQQAGARHHFNGSELFFEDLFRSAPFDIASTIPDLGISSISSPIIRENDERETVRSKNEGADKKATELGENYLRKVKEIPSFRSAIGLQQRGGSNGWVIDGTHTLNKRPLLANDPHLTFDAPSVFYPIHLRTDDIDVIGNGFAGIPFVITGQTKHIAWGATVNPMDVTDIFQEQIVPDPSSPSGLSTVYQGKLNPIIAIQEKFRHNNLNNDIHDDLTEVMSGGEIPAVTLIVPRRNNGPIIQFDPKTGVALSIQYIGFSATREPEAFLIWNQARGLNDFLNGLQYLDSGTFNFVYSDTRGNIAYLTSGEMPLREDLQSGRVNGFPPFLLRDGTGGNEWLPLSHPQPQQAILYEILPFSEMPQIINPPGGWIVNTNNDPIGNTLDNNPLNELRPDGGIYYLNYNYESGFRAGRVTQLIREKLSTGSGKISFKEMQEMQADTTLLDAKVFVPYILQAFNNAKKADAHPLLSEYTRNLPVASAINRLKHWNFGTPTGIPEGYDSNDTTDQLLPPSADEISSSISATIYSVWRGQFIGNTIDATLTPLGISSPGGYSSMSTLRHLLDTFSVNNGVGASRLNFFAVEGVPNSTDRRDFLILKSLSDALTLLSSETFAIAFNRSKNQDDYRWGKLHRVIFNHPLDGAFDIPPGGGALPAPFAALPGIPTDGGFGTIDAATHFADAKDVSSFMFINGPSYRYVSEARHHGMYAESSLPGGVSGDIDNIFYLNLLPGWLTNKSFPLLQHSREMREHTTSITRFKPIKKRNLQRGRTND